MKRSMGKWRGCLGGLTLGVVLAALAAPPATLGDEEPTLSPVASPPLWGTFFSMQRTDYPPFPFNPFPELPLYQIGKAIYVYDDRSVDYVALRALAAANGMSPAGFSGGGAQVMSGPSPPLPPGGGGGGGGGGGVSNPPPYSVPGLKLTIPVFTNGYIYTTIFEHDPTMGYDLYYLTNLNLTNWTAVLGNLAGLTNYWLTNSFTTDVFLRMASGLDSDGDGMLDGWELLHGFNPHSAGDAAQDADGDGLTNLQEFQQGGDPKSAVAWAVFVATPRGTSALP